jgi:protein-arginine kinase activator protein McsA
MYVCEKIFSGVKVDNIMLRTIKQVDGTFAELCQNCKHTFKELIESGRIIAD